LHGVRQAEFLDRADLRLDDAENHVDAEALLHHGGTEAAVVRRVGEIHVTTFFELLDLCFAEEAIGEATRVLGSQQGGVVPDRAEVAITAPGGLRTGGEMEVGRIILHAEAQVIVHGAQHGQKIFRPRKPGLQSGEQKQGEKEMNAGSGKRHTGPVPAVELGDDPNQRGAASIQPMMSAVSASMNMPVRPERRTPASWPSMCSRRPRASAYKREGTQQS
jgi:hypothetical protein